MASCLWKQRPAPPPAAPPGLLALFIPPPARPLHTAAATPAASHGAHAAALAGTGRANATGLSCLVIRCSALLLAYMGRQTAATRLSFPTSYQSTSTIKLYKGAECEIWIHLLANLNTLQYWQYNDSKAAFQSPYTF